VHYSAQDRVAAAQLAGIGPGRATGSLRALPGVRRALRSIIRSVATVKALAPALNADPTNTLDTSRLVWHLYAIAYIAVLYAFAYCRRTIMLDAIARNEKQIGAILRRARRKAGLTQEALGDVVHLRQATISHLEAGKPTVQLRTLMATLSSLGLEIVIRQRSRGSPAEFEDLF